MRVKYMRVKTGKKLNISQYPNFSVTGSIVGMCKIYGENALLVRSGSYIYNVPQSVYDFVQYNY